MTVVGFKAEKSVEGKNFFFLPIFLFSPFNEPCNYTPGNTGKHWKNPDVEIPAVSAWFENSCSDSMFCHHGL